ncbi:MAG TPA: hypothetical protein VJ831_03050 [Jatrophihabitantaceae bacterium]|nr:hypothetical protein [Jatrophihabitantaceae bacterium]
MAADLRGAERTRSRWLLPIAAIAVVLAVAAGTVVASGMLSSGHHRPSSPAQARAGSREVVLRPVTAAGTAAPAFAVTDDDTAVMCSAGLASYVAVDDGIAWCTPAYLGAVACWPSAEAGYVLCLQDAWKKTVVRHPLTGTFPPSTARAQPAPLGVELGDGTRCLIRSSGTGENLVGHPGWTYTYFCGAGNALWAPGFSSTVDRSSATWTAQEASTDGRTPPHTVQVTTVYLAGTAAS